MKKIFYSIYFFATLFTCGCAAGGFRDIQGKYTCAYQNEFYKIHDTLILQNVNKDVYQVERRTGVDQKMKLENWMLEFDVEKNVLHELQKGKFVVIINGDLIFGNRTYKKIKE